MTLNFFKESAVGAAIGCETVRKEIPTDQWEFLSKTFDLSLKRDDIHGDNYADQKICEVARTKKNLLLIGINESAGKWYERISYLKKLLANRDYVVALKEIELESRYLGEANSAWPIERYEVQSYVLVVGILKKK